MAILNKLYPAEVKRWWEGVIDLVRVMHGGIASAFTLIERFIEEKSVHFKASGNVIQVFDS